MASCFGQVFCWVVNILSIWFDTFLLWRIMYHGNSKLEKGRWPVDCPCSFPCFGCLSQTVTFLETGSHSEVPSPTVIFVSNVIFPAYVSFLRICMLLQLAQVLGATSILKQQILPWRMISVLCCSPFLSKTNKVKTWQKSEWVFRL